DHGVHSGLNRDAARLPLPLPAMPVAEGEQRAVDIDPEIASGPGAHLRRSPVAAVRVGHQRGPRLEGSRRHANGAVHRIQREGDGEVAPAGPVGDGPRLRIDLVDPDPLVQGRLQGCGMDWAGAGQRAEEGDRRGRREVTGRGDRDEMHGQRVARLGALDIERTGLRVHEGELDDATHEVGWTAYLPAERVTGPT